MYPLKLLRREIAPPKWPSYTGTSQFAGAGAGGRVNVFYDPSLGAPGKANAAALVNDAARIVAANDAIFGTRGGVVNVIIFALGGANDGSGGADHMGCDYATGSAIEVCAAFGDDMMVSGLFEAELSECAMNGNLCGLSTGEALSRWCTISIDDISHSQIWTVDFASAPVWAGGGMPDFVNVTDQTDRNYDSIGCGMAFLSWLQVLGHPLSKIAPAMVKLGNNGTLADLYAAMGGTKSSAWSGFMGAVKALPHGVVSDDPFGALTMPVPVPVPPPIPAPPPPPVPPVPPVPTPSHTDKIKQDLRMIGVLLGDIVANM
jgi:hypothetical protein